MFYSEYLEIFKNNFGGCFWFLQNPYYSIFFIQLNLTNFNYITLIADNP